MSGNTGWQTLRDGLDKLFFAVQVHGRASCARDVTNDEVKTPGSSYKVRRNGGLSRVLHRANEAERQSPKGTSYCGARGFNTTVGATPALSALRPKGSGHGALVADRSISVAVRFVAAFCEGRRPFPP